jgi:HPt (histidine-containing phosphotransfer) domain-containing protein
VPADDVLDPVVIAGLRQAQDAFGNPEFIRQLAGLFQARTPLKMDRIRQAIADADAVAVREAAHALKSNCGMLGAARMADACARMEEAAARADLDAAAAAFREAEEQMPAVLTALADLTA